MTEGRVAILIPVYRAQRLLERTLASLRDDKSEFEVFIIDDGSDPPIRIEERHNFPVHLIRLCPNGGIAKALNAGLNAIRRSHFDFVARLDAGDVHIPRRLEAQKQFLSHNPTYSMVGSAYQIFSESGKFLYEIHPPLTDSKIKRTLRIRNVFCHPSVMLRGDILGNDFFYSEELRVGSDYDLWLRLAKVTKLGNLDEVFVKCVVDECGLTSTRKRRYMSRIKTQWQHFDVRNLYCYIGLVRSLFMCFMPYGLRRDVYAYFTKLTRASSKQANNASNQSLSV